MRRIIISVVLGLGVLAIGYLLFTSARSRERVMDERVTLREKHKIPYGYYAARQMLPSLFPGSKIYSGTQRPSDWRAIEIAGKGQVVFFPCFKFSASRAEMEQLHAFVKRGNHVFVIARQLSYEARQFLGLSSSQLSYQGYSQEESMVTRLLPPIVPEKRSWSYAGKREGTNIGKYDSSATVVLGENRYNEASFIQLRAGEGTFSVNLEPLAYSNYFLLQKNNMEYLERSVSAIPGDVQKVLWSEYFFVKKELPDKEPSWLAILFRFQSFRWAFVTAIALGLLYVLLEMRRKQRVIPVIAAPRNESLDFVQTVGRLYYDRKDHKDLAIKMTAYFFDDVRNRFKLSAQHIDTSFRESLQMKSGYPEDKLAELLQTMDEVRMEEQISETTLYRYHKQLENFYQNT